MFMLMTITKQHIYKLYYVHYNVWSFNLHAAISPHKLKLKANLSTEESLSTKHTVKSQRQFLTSGRGILKDNCILIILGYQQADFLYVTTD